MEGDGSSLKSLFASARSLYKGLDSLASNSEAYEDRLRDAISIFQKCKEISQRASLFSANEIVDDIPSNDIQFLAIEYYLGDLLFIGNIGNRRTALQGAQTSFGEFLSLNQQYELLPNPDKKLYKQWHQDRDKFSVAPTDPVKRREIKIARLSRENELKQKLKFLESNPAYFQGDDAAVRDLYLAQLSIQVHQSFQSLDFIAQELQLLSFAQTVRAPDPPSSVPDSRERNNAPSSNYSDRLDPSLRSLLNSRGQNGPLLSKSGKPLQPFVLMDQRQQLRDGVFRPGHSLPTMTIDEYLEEEKRRGGMIEGGGEQPGKVVDEDDLKAADEETIKQREWDEFKEDNPKGSGNTLNRG